MKCINKCIQILSKRTYVIDNVQYFKKIHFTCYRFALERSELTSGIRWGAWETGILLAAFTAAQLTYYSCLPYMLKFSTAAELHLSHLASDFYSILAGLLLFQTNVSWPCIQINFSFLVTITLKKQDVNYINVDIWS